MVEIVVGLLVLAGLLTRAAAAAGLALNLVLFLTASWNTSPYFLGPDLVFVFAWLPFVLAGADGQPSLASAIDGRARPRREGSLVPTGEVAFDRRRMLRQSLAAVGAASVGLSGFSALAKLLIRQPNGAVTGGPAQRALAQKQVLEHRGRVYALPG